ncbi:hypothetical protein DFAR_2550008 [Desulfarculales bacterium]
MTLCGCAPRSDRVLEMLLKLGGSAPPLLALGTEFNDHLTIKLLELIAAELEHTGGGGRRCPTCGWPWAARAGASRPCVPTRTTPSSSPTCRPSA